MSRIDWLIGAALTMLVAVPVTAQQRTDPSQADAGAIHAEAQPWFEFQQVGPNAVYRRVESTGGPTAVGETMHPGAYWLGVHCSPVPLALRSHLAVPEKQGLLVLLVSKDSPAGKAGIAQYDILLRAGGKSLAEPRDLVTAVEAAKESKLKIDLIRGGKPKTIEAVPAKWPEQLSGGPVQVPEQSDWNTIQGWLGEIAPGQEGAGAHGPINFHILQPGAIVPKDVFIGKPLPANMKVLITKEGNEPAKIIVKSGDKKWEITEKELDKLPADVRPHIERMLGRGMFGWVGGAVPPGMSGGVSSGGGFFQPPVPTPGMPQTQPLPGSVDQQIEKRFDELNRRMDKLFKMMEELSQGHAQHATPEQHEEK